MMDLVTVDIPQGRLRGKKVTSSTNGVTYYSFQGIPYAKPPVGPLRFKPPEEPEPWEGTRDAIVEGAVAPQIDFFAKKVAGEEDCLFLNVYTPQWPATSPKKAVMVWIHGGAFILGSGNSDVYGPDFLISEDVVIVTINYRLGALGFLYLEGADITGNNGLRDQVMALKWVKKNIVHFGGDADNVTIFGESAGGMSVHYLMLSPLAAGLFHRAIVQSGTALICSCNMPCDVSSQRAVRLSNMLGCSPKDPQQVVDFLRTVPAEKFVTHQSAVKTSEEKDRITDVAFIPTEEVGPEAFLPASPSKLVHEGRYNKVPLIIGVTSGEGKLMLLGMFLHKKLAEIEKFENLLPLDLILKTDVEKLKEIANVVKEFYFEDSSLSEDTLIQFIDMMSDMLFVHPMHQTVMSQVRWSHHPTYAYLFDHWNEAHWNSMTNNVDNLPGVPHAAEIPFLFHSTAPGLFNTTLGPADILLRDKIVRLWAHFAKTGNALTDDVTWLPAEKQKLNYLKINSGFSMDSDMYKHRNYFWEELYNKFLPQDS